MKDNINLRYGAEIVSLKQRNAKHKRREQFKQTKFCLR